MSVWLKRNNLFYSISRLTRFRRHITVISVSLTWWRAAATGAREGDNSVCDLSAYNAMDDIDIRKAEHIPYPISQERRRDNFMSVATQRKWYSFMYMISVGRQLDELSWSQSTYSSLISMSQSVSGCAFSASRVEHVQHVIYDYRTRHRLHERSIAVYTWPVV